MPASISLKQRLQPLMSGAVSLSDLDTHTRQALGVFVHFRGLEIAELRDPEKIKAELARIPEPVRELVRQSAICGYKKLGFRS